MGGQVGEIGLVAIEHLLKMIVWLPFPEAEKIVRSLKLKNMKQYQESLEIRKDTREYTFEPL